MVQVFTIMVAQAEQVVLAAVERVRARVAVLVVLAQRILVAAVAEVCAGTRRTIQTQLLVVLVVQVS